MAQDFTLLVGTKVDDTQILQQLNTISKKTSVTVKVNADTSSIESLKTVTTKGTDAMGNLVTTTEKFNKSGESLGTVVSSVTQKMETYNKTSSSASQANEQISSSADKASKSTKSLGADFVDTTLKVAKFGASTAVIGVFYNAIQEAKEAVTDFDSAMTEFNKVSSLGEDQLGSYTDRLSEMGEEVARTRTEMLESATEFVKTGASEEDAAQLAKISEMYRNIADEQISSSDSAALLTSQMKAFNFTAQESEHVIDAINEVSNNYAVSSSDVSSALTKTSSAMSVLGNSFEETIGLVTAGTEIMTGQASKVARGLRTIGNNIADTANKTGELSYSVEGTTESISLLDEATGDMKSTYQVLGEIAEDWDRMSSSEQQAIAISLAGKNQFEVFGAVLSNFNNAVEATETALGSSGSAMRENEAYMSSLQAKITALKGQFQELILGDGGLTSFAKILIDAGTTVLKFANSDVGQLIIKLGLLYTALTLAGKGFSLLSATKLGANITLFNSLATSSIGLSGALGTLAGALKATAIEWASSPFVVGTAIIGGFVALKETIDYVYEAFDRNVQKLNELNSAYESQTQTVDNTEKSLEEVRAKIAEINGIKLDITDEEQLKILQKENETEEEKLKRLREEEASLENQLRIEQEKLNTQKQQLEAQAQKTLTSEKAIGVTNIGGSSVGATYKVEKATPTEALAKYTEEMQKSQSTIDSYLSKKQELENANKEETDEYKELVNSIDEEIAKRDEARDEASDYADIINDAIKNLDKESDLYKDVQDVLNDYLDTTDNVRNSLEDTGDEAEGTASKMYDLGSYSMDSMNAMNEATSDSQQIISDLASEIDNITSAYQTAVDAQYEYNQQGYLSVDTYSQLMQLAPQYLAMMIDENGQLYANADATTIAYQAKVYEMGITAARAQIQLADSLASEAGAYAALGSAAAGSTPSVYSLLEAELKLKRATLDDADYNALVKNVNAISTLTKSTIDNAKYTTASIKPTQASTSATNKNTGARKSNADATKSQTDALKAHKKALEAEADALEAEIDDYETVIDYVKDLLQEEKEAVEEEKDAQLEAIQDKIDALEEEQEAFEENIDAQIDALEKQKDETEEYWDAQIEAIENANDVLEENMELQRLQEALASAKTQKVKVLKGGRFVYSEDEEAISKAEQELADYEMQLAVQRQIEELERLKEEALNSLEQQIEELESYREEQQKNYEQQLKDLQDHYDKVEEEYDKRIEQYDKWLKEFEDMLEASSKRHAQILYNELVNEQGNWDARIKALGTFVHNYEKKKNELDGIKNQINAITNQISALESKAKTLQNSVNGINNQVSNQLANINSMAKQAEKAANELNDGYNAIMRTQYRGYLQTAIGHKIYVTGWNVTAEAARQALNSYIQKNPGVMGGLWTTTGVDKLNKWATGTYSVPDDQIALVADPMRPSNRELVVGSKINNGDGILTSLKKGSGVIPAGQNLTENLVNLARWSQNGMIQKAFTTMNNSNTNSKVVKIENINLPYIKDGKDFVEYLEMNFLNDSIQYSNIRE